MFVVDKPEVVVGRSRGADLVLFDKSVSREHAKLIAHQDVHLLLDLGTKFGTFVNGLPIRACQLKNGDQIAFGEEASRFTFEALPGADVNDSGENSSRHESGLDDAKDPVFDMLVALLHAELGRNRERRMLLQSDLMLASGIQRALLPQEMPDLHGFRLRAHSKATRYVGGDFYEFMPTTARDICGVLGDVSGKGVAASLLSAMVLGCLDACLRSGSSLEAAVQTLNALLFEKGNGRYVTLFLFHFDSNGRGEFVSAGHNTAYVYRYSVGLIEEVSSNNTICGSFPDMTFHGSALALDRGDLMLVYSDGVTEAENLAEEMLGEARVRDLIQFHGREGAGAVKDALVDLIDTFTVNQKQMDDITFVVVQRM